MRLNALKKEFPQRSLAVLKVKTKSFVLGKRTSQVTESANLCLQVLMVFEESLDQVQLQCLFGANDATQDKRACCSWTQDFLKKSEINAEHSDSSG